MFPTPSRRNLLLRTSLRKDRVLTTVQLERQGLMAAAEELKLPRVTLTYRTRVTQPHSSIGLTFVALDETFLRRPQHELMHDAGLAEARRQSPALREKTLKHLDLRGQTRGRLPDAVYLAPSLETALDWAIEFDAGYDRERIEAKLRAADREGYANYLWATTIRARTVQIGEVLRKLHAQEGLRHLEHVEARFVDFWSIRDPYQDSRRTHKRLSVEFAPPTWEEVAQ